MNTDQSLVCGAGWRNSVFEVNDPNRVRSANGNVGVEITFKNHASYPVEMFWYDYGGILVSYGSIASGDMWSVNTFETHPWGAEGGAGCNLINGHHVFMTDYYYNKMTVDI